MSDPLTPQERQMLDEHREWLQRMCSVDGSPLTRLIDRLAERVTALQGVLDTAGMCHGCGTVGGPGKCPRMRFPGKTVDLKCCEECSHKETP